MVDIREGTASDRRPLVAIQERALAEPAPALLDAALEGLLSLLVADDEAPVGYAVVVTGHEGVAYVPELAVHPDRQGQGYGTRLLSAVCDRLDTAGYDEVRLTILAGDDRVRRFYERMGFVAHERLPDHFDRGDGLVFVRRL